MPRLVRKRYLTCFYCGRRTSTPYDGRVRHFDCPNCEATNYLDENGEITDPPVATDKEATPAKLAVARAHSPPGSPPGSTNSVFCSTCLKNQHLLTASLAQYLPDPGDPDYDEREKGYWRFRKNQEKLYPQICSDCEPRVRAAMEQAAYTAKADVLRRMIERSNMERRNVKTRGWLDTFDRLGGWLRFTGLVLQLLWHISLLHVLLADHFKALVGAEDETILAVRVLGWIDPFLGYLPSAEGLMRWSTIATVASVWWNPKFVQTFRGFTRHISGVSKWYLFQIIAVIMRVLLSNVAILTSTNPALFNMQASGHVFAAAFAVLVYSLGPRAIKINMEPLFGTNRQPTKLRESPPSKQERERPDEMKVMTELLDEIANTPARPRIDDSPILQPTIPRSNFGSSISSSTISTTPLGYPARNQQQLWGASARTPASASSELPLDSLDLSGTPRPHYEEEMDWSPTQSRHRAFNTVGQRDGQGFNAAPTEPHKGPFWYKVPAAPTTPAQRLFNPPNQPRLRLSPANQNSNAAVNKREIAFRGPDKTVLSRDNRAVTGQERQERPVTFAEPSFFPQPPRDDPRDPLSDLFVQSFTLSEEEERARREAEERGSGWLSSLGFSSAKKKQKNK